MSFLRFDRNGVVEVYTDGSCKNNGRSNSVAGLGVWFNDNHRMNLSETLTRGYQTNQTAEIQAARRAIEQARMNRIYSLRIISDSEYVVKGITEWIHNWRQNGGKDYYGRPVVNLQLFYDLEDAWRSMDRVYWEYVPAHKGHYGNEAADRLAKQATL